MLYRFIVVAVGLVACDELRPCPQLACSDAVRVKVAPPLAAAGRYSVELVADSFREHCEFALPGARQTSRWRQCAPHISVKETEGSVEQLMLSLAPKHLELRVSTSDGMVRQLKANPGYRIERPNGEHCEPSCRVADTVLEMGTGGDGAPGRLRGP